MVRHGDKPIGYGADPLPQGRMRFHLSENGADQLRDHRAQLHVGTGPGMLDGQVRFVHRAVDARGGRRGPQDGRAHALRTAVPGHREPGSEARRHGKIRGEGIAYRLAVQRAVERREEGVVQQAVERWKCVAAHHQVGLAGEHRTGQLPDELRRERLKVGVEQHRSLCAGLRGQPKQGRLRRGRLRPWRG